MRVFRIGWLYQRSLLATDLIAVMPERLANVLAQPENGFARNDLPLPAPSSNEPE